MLFGFIFNAYSFAWLYTAYPLIWMPEGPVQLAGIFTLHIILSIVSALGFCSVGWFLHIQSRQAFKPFIFAISLTIAELIRSLCVSTIFLGDGGKIDFHYTASTLGNALSVTPFIEFAYFGGTFALTFILGYLLYIGSTVTHLKTYWAHVASIVILLLCLHIIVPTYGPPNPVVVGVITTNFKTQPDDQIISSFQQQNKEVHDLTLSFASSSPDIIVYPEDTRYIEYLSNKERDTLSILFPKTLFVDGNTNTYKGKMVNVSLFYFADTKKILARGKSFLLPFNEFIPFFFHPIFSLFIQKEDMDDYIRNHTYTPIYSPKTISFNGIRIGTLLCSEILSYATIQDVHNENPSLVFFQSHLNVFHDNPLAWAMLNSSARVAAAQLRRPLISSINGAPSFIVSPYGILITTIPTGFSTSTYTFSKTAN